MSETFGPDPIPAGRYRPADAAISLNFGAALRAILPAAFQSAVIGSILSAVLAIILWPADIGAVLWETGPAGAVMLACGWFFAGTMAGTLFAAFYIATLGLPLALAMRQHIASRGALAVAIIISGAAGVIAIRYLDIADAGGANWYYYAFGLAYAIPAGIAYRREVLMERFLSSFP